MELPHPLGMQICIDCSEPATNSPAAQVVRAIKNIAQVLDSTVDVSPAPVGLVLAIATSAASRKRKSETATRANRTGEQGAVDPPVLVLHLSAAEPRGGRAAD